MAATLDKKKQAALARFLERRNLKSRIVELLGAAIESNNLDRGELTQNKNATYAALVEYLVKALDRNWVTVEDLTAVLSDSEVAGRQHVCVYQVPQQSAKSVLDALVDPVGLDTSKATIDDYLEVPDSSYAQVLASTKDEALIKIVAPRRYWRTEVDPKSTDDHQLLHKWRITERSAVI